MAAQVTGNSLSDEKTSKKHSHNIKGQIFPILVDILSAGLFANCAGTSLVHRLLGCWLATRCGLVSRLSLTINTRQISTLRGGGLLVNAFSMTKIITGV